MRTPTPAQREPLLDLGVRQATGMGEIDRFATESGINLWAASSRE
jgi:hypothetical protein